MWVSPIHGMLSHPLIIEKSQEKEESEGNLFGLQVKLPLVTTSLTT